MIRRDTLEHVLTGEFALRANDPARAYQEFMRAARKSRQADIAGRAFAAAEAAQNEEAAGLAFALWKELDPDNSRVRLLRTGELFTKGQFEEAGKIAQGLLAESDDPAALLENIMQLSSGVEEKARLYETLSPIFSKNNEDARVELVLASLAASAKMREEARKHGAAAIELAPNNPHILLQGDLPSPTNIPAGCPFHTRCPLATEKCKTEAPKPHTVGERHTVTCHYPEKTV